MIDFHNFPTGNTILHSMDTYQLSTRTRIVNPIDTELELVLISDIEYHQNKPSFNLPVRNNRHSMMTFWTPCRVTLINYLRNWTFQISYQSRQSNSPIFYSCLFPLAKFPRQLLTSIKEVFFFAVYFSKKRHSNDDGALHIRQSIDLKDEIRLYLSVNIQINSCTTLNTNDYESVRSTEYEIWDQNRHLNKQSQLQYSDHVSDWNTCK